MSNDKYVGLDVHQASIVVAVLNAQGKCVCESILETKGSTIVDFITSLSGTLHLTFEEGTQSVWLYDLIRPRVAELVVCDPRKNRLLAGDNKSDRVDANKLAHRLRLGELKAVYKGEAGLRRLKELVHSYESLVGDRTRVCNRIKAIYRGRGIACGGRAVYHRTGRQEYLAQLTESGLRERAESLYLQLDLLTPLRRAARRVMLAESRRHAANEVLRSVPAIGPVRAAQILAAAMTPHRFRTKRQFWPYCGLAVVTRSTADYCFVGGKVGKRARPAPTRGLNRNHNHRLKQVFKSAAVEALKREPFRSYYQGLVAGGIKPELARVSVARKLAAVTLAVWKKGERFKAEEVKRVAA